MRVGEFTFHDQDYDALTKMKGISTLDKWLLIACETNISCDGKKGATSVGELNFVLCIEPHKFTLLRIHPFPVDWTT